MKYGKLSRKNIETLERLAETPEGKAALMEFVEKQKEARKAYKRYVKLINKKEKTPNEIRAAFIEKCKRYIEKHGNGVEFTKSEDEWFTTRLLAYGISNTKGVSNEHIKKANALAWLLKDYSFVDKTRNAPQPDEVVAGHVVKTFGVRGGIHMTGKVKEVLWDEERILYHKEDFEKAFDFMYTYTSTRYGFEIIDDTNAKYKEGTK